MTDTSPTNVEAMIERLRYHDLRVKFDEAADMLEALAAENAALRTRAETADMRADNLSDKLELERALTDGAHRRATAAALRAALERQGDNMAFVLNHMSVPKAYYEKFLRELEEDRAALTGGAA